MRLISDEKFDEEPFDLELPILGGAGLAPARAVHGPCNGIFCIEPLSCLLPLILWNPATKETKVLPSCHPYGRDSEIQFYYKLGFGIDPKTNNFKIVRISYSALDFWKNVNERSPYMVEVYNLSSNSWKTIGSNSWKIIGGILSPVDLATPNFNSYLNGVYHWKGYRKNHVITCFDMSKEIFWQMEIPDCLKGRDYLDWRIAVINDCVACIKVPSNLTDSLADIWIMGEYGVQESWTRRYKIAVDFKRFRGLGRHISIIDSVLEWMASCYPLSKEKELEVLTYASVLFTASRYAESLFPLSVLE